MTSIAALRHRCLPVQEGISTSHCCGSLPAALVDDGKSTLIGRLLYDSKMIFEDQLATLAADSKRIGTQGQDIDFALLVDGLAAERGNRASPSMCAYRYFATEKRKFIVADTPGHEQYTRNMVTGASTANLAVILVDARKGVLTQTRRHSYLTHLLGIKSIVLAVNKMDLVNYAQATFDAIIADYRTFADSIGIQEFIAIPISSLAGDNITSASGKTAWYSGPSLILRQISRPLSISIDTTVAQGAAAVSRMPVQWVNRPNLDFPRFCAVLISQGRLSWTGRFGARSVIGQNVDHLCANRHSGCEDLLEQGGRRTGSHAHPGRPIGLQPRRCACRRGGAS